MALSGLGLLLTLALTPSARMTAARTSVVPNIDGVDEAVWQAAPRSRDFVQRAPGSHRPFGGHG